MGTFYDRNFLANAVTLEDSMTGNVLAEETWRILRQTMFYRTPINLVDQRYRT